MSKPASDATLLRRERADNKRLRAELSAASTELQRLKAANTLLAKAVEDWKERFDLLLKRDAKGGTNAS